MQTDTVDLRFTDFELSEVCLRLGCSFPWQPNSVLQVGDLAFLLNIGDPVSEIPLPASGLLLLGGLGLSAMVRLRARRGAGVPSGTTA